MVTTSETGFAGAHEARPFVAGGAVQAAGGMYLRRGADDELLELCRAGAFAYILTSRQMGKSSLMVETVGRLQFEGIRTVTVDLTGLGTDPTHEQWYRAILIEISDQLGLHTDAASWWGAQGESASITQRFINFIENVLLREVSGRLVIFFDEIDTTLRLDYTDDFFISIRYFYNSRAVNPELVRLSFVLIGVASPGDLIKDPERTPFNIGHRVDLDDFTIEEARPLTAGLFVSDSVLRRALHWTGGHPYLTLRLFRSFQTDPPASWSDREIDRRANMLFFGENSKADSNLQFVRGMLTDKLNKPDRDVVLEVYRSIARSRRVQDGEQDYAKSWLKLSGVVKRDGDLLRVRNRIYARVFTPGWVTEHVTVDWSKRLALVAKWVFLFLVMCAIPLAIYAWKLAVDARMAEAEATKQKNLAIAAQEESQRQFELAREAERFAKEQASIASAQRDTSLRLSQQSAARGLLAYSANVLSSGGDPELAALLALESLKREPNDTGAQAVRNAMFYLRKQRFAGGADARPVQVGFSPDGSRLIAAGADNLARIYDVRTGTLLLALQHDGPVYSAVFSKTGPTVLTGSADRSARVWDAITGRERTRVICPQPVTAVALSPDDKLAATSCAGLRVWDLSTGKQLRESKATGPPAFSPDGQWLVDLTLSTRQVALWNRSSSRVRSIGFSQAPIAFRHDSRVVALSQGRDIKVGQIGDSLTTLPGNSDAIVLAFRPNGPYLASGEKDGFVRIWDTDRQQRLLTNFSHQGAVTSITWSPDGHLLATGSADKTVRLWLANRGEEVARVAFTDVINDVVMSPNGRSVASSASNSPVRVLQTNSPWLLTFDHDVSALAFRSDGRGIAIGAGPATWIWDLNSDDAPRHIAPSGSDLLSFSPDGNQLFLMQGHRVYEIWDVRNRRRLNVLPGTPYSAAFVSPDRIFTADLRGGARIYNLASGLSQPIGPSIPDYVLSISGDGRRIATRSNSGEVKLTDVSSGKTVLSFKPQGLVKAGALDAAGKFLVVILEEGKAELWDVNAGRQVTQITDRGPIKAIALSPNGRYIATAVGNRVRINPWRHEDLMVAACGLLSRSLSTEEWARYIGTDPQPTCTSKPITPRK